MFPMAITQHVVFQYLNLMESKGVKKETTDSYLINQY
jgi:hypothetical protein